MQIETQGRTTVPIRAKSATPGNKTTGGIPISIPEKYCHLLSSHIAHSEHHPGGPEPVETLPEPARAVWRTVLSDLGRKS